MALVDLTSVTTGSIGTNTNFIVEENKVLKRISQSSLLKTSAISTTHVNSTTNVPSSSLVYSMNQAINTLNSDLNGFTFYKSLEQLNISSGFIPDIVAAMPFSSIFVIQCIEGQVISNESRNQLPSANGLLEIIRSTTGRTRVLYTTGTNTSKTGLYLCDLNEISNIINRWIAFSSSDNIKSGTYILSENIPAGDSVTVTIQFENEFKNTPDVCVCLISNTDSVNMNKVNTYVRSRYADHFVCEIQNGSSTTMRPALQWIAVST